ncbi:Rieske (2Fe-2S) protein [Cytobacillus sp. FJAT-53684]|uniref:Rieske (2Fe-2S) protein n=1 Tax=Cytobacillus mangrovibacter TaxID=3299024 RepID=A0ABW6K622_9BACI
MNYRLGEVSELSSKRCNNFEIDGKSIAVLYSQGTFYALSNTCPHKGASMCAGDIRGTMIPSNPSEINYDMEDKVLVCPWHGYEFDIETGKPLFGVTKSKLKTYTVFEENGDLFIQI